MKKISCGAIIYFKLLPVDTYVGSAVLVTTTTDMDKTGASYYGEQGLHYLSMRGDGNMVPLGME